MRKQLLCGVATLAIVAAVSGPVMADGMPMKAGPAPSVFAPNWSGFYAGGTVGYGWGKFSGNESNVGALPDAKVDGGVIGIHGGYNWQYSSVVLGIEGDLTGAFGSGWSKTNLTCPTCGNSGLHGELNGIASIRGRLGWAFDRTLVYATGGVAWGHYNSGAGATGIPIANNTVTGGVVGGGIEWKYRPDVSFRVEGMHYLFNKTVGPTSSDVGTGANTIHNVSLVRVGATFHFGK